MVRITGTAVAAYGYRIYSMLHRQKYLASDDAIVGAHASLGTDEDQEGLSSSVIPRAVVTRHISEKLSIYGYGLRQVRLFCGDSLSSRDREALCMRGAWHKKQHEVESVLESTEGYSPDKVRVYELTEVTISK